MDATQLAERRKSVTIPQEEFEAMLERAAERGAKNALHGVGLDHNARGLHINQLKRAEARAQMFCRKRNYCGALFDGGKVNSLNNLALRYGAQKSFWPAQAHNGLVDETVSHHKVGGDAKIIKAYFDLRFQPVANADHVPHAHGDKDRQQHGKQVRRAA